MIKLATTLSIYPKQKMLQYDRLHRYFMGRVPIVKSVFLKILIMSVTY